MGTRSDKPRLTVGAKYMDLVSRPPCHIECTRKSLPRYACGSASIILLVARGADRFLLTRLGGQSKTKMSVHINS